MASGSVNVPGVSYPEFKKQIENHTHKPSQVGIIISTSTTNLPEVVDGAILIAYDKKEA